MALNKGLMDRLGDRKAGNSVVSGIEATLPLHEKRVHIYRFVAASIMPRDIVLTGGKFKLVLTASNRNLMNASLFEGETSVFQDDFGDVSDNEVDGATKRGLLDAVLLLLNQPNDITVKFERAIGDFDDSFGVHADLISSDQDLPEAAPEIKAEPKVLQEPDPAPSLEQMVAVAEDEKAEIKHQAEEKAKRRYVPEEGAAKGSDGDSISMTGVPGGLEEFSQPVSNPPATAPAQKTSGSVPVPFGFVDLTRAQAIKSLYFSYDGSDALENKMKNDIFVERSDLPRLSAWHDRLSSTLGDELLVVLVPYGDSEDRLAISINPNEGAGISFGPKKMGQIFAAWIKSRLENT